MNDVARFLSNVSPEPNTGCWLWTRAANGPSKAGPGGYGLAFFGGRWGGAHRASYTIHKGPPPPGTVLDHLCRTPICVNPDHLEAVSQRENALRGEAFAWRRRMTHCSRGHRFTPQNTYRVRDRNKFTGFGGRRCRACQASRRKGAK